MASEAGIFIGWNRTFPGAEEKAVGLFGEFVGYLEQRKGAGDIESYEPVILQAHGGDLNGFFLIRGDRNKLDRMAATDEYIGFVTRAALILQDLGSINAFVGEGVPKQLSRMMKIAAG